MRGEGNDSWAWEKEQSGLYMVRSAYKWLVQSDLSENDVFYNMLWKGDVPLKVKAFIWKLPKNRIPSLLNLVKRNIPLQSLVCVGCECEEESAGSCFLVVKFSPLFGMNV